MILNSDLSLKWWEKFLLPSALIIIVVFCILGFYVSQQNANARFWIFEHTKLLSIWAVEYGHASVASIFVDDYLNGIRITGDQHSLSTAYDLPENADRETQALIALGGLLSPLFFTFLLVFGGTMRSLVSFLLWIVSALLVQSTLWMTTATSGIGYTFLMYALVITLFATFAPNVIKVILCVAIGLQICLFNIIYIPDFFNQQTPVYQGDLSLIASVFIGQPWLWGFFISILYLFITLYILKLTVWSSMLFFRDHES